MNPTLQAEIREVGRGYKSAKVSVNTSQSLAQLGITIPAGACSLSVWNEGAAALRIQYDGSAADANSGGIAPGYSIEISGNADDLAKLRFFAGSANAVSFHLWQE
jgi:hypothetical protein